MKGKRIVLTENAATPGQPDDAAEPVGGRVDHSRPLREQVYAIIRRAILTGEYAPGATLDEKAIALGLGVSRTPVREAVKKLSDENLVVVKAQSSTLIAPIDLSQIRESFLIRRALEVESVAQAADRMNERHKDRLDQIYLLHELAIHRRRYIDAIVLDDEFHRYISEISGLPRLWKAIDISKAQLDRCRYLAVPRPGRAEVTLKQHRLIIDALTSRDRKLSARMMRNHLENAYRDIVGLLELMRDGRAEEARAPRVG
jgi:DNA-binding GntR family transcriptional regulator